jgi:hypothetical protein
MCSSEEAAAEKLSRGFDDQNFRVDGLFVAHFIQCSFLVATVAWFECFL